MKRFNYTGRKKILHEDIHIRLHGAYMDPPVIDVSLNLKEYQFPDDAEVYVEPQRQTRFMRIKIGLVSRIEHGNSIKLNEFDDADDLQFRIKIVSPLNGKLLGIAENVRPFNKDDQLDDNQLSILPVRSKDLSQEGILWQVAFNGESAVLEIEKELGGKDQVVRSLLFKGFVLPAAMKQILIKILSEDWDEDLLDTSELSTRWLLFVKQMGMQLPDRGSENDEWLEAAVRILANRIGVRTQIINDFQSGVWK